MIQTLRTMIAKRPWIKSTLVWKHFSSIWSLLIGYYEFYIYRHKRIENQRIAKAFFEKEQDRVDKITSWLADEESKETFVKMIKFRQTGKLKYYVSHGLMTQYFINNFFKYSKNEVLIDCGAFIGDSIELFLSLPNIDYKKIYALEPDPKNIRVLEDREFVRSAGNKITPIMAGAYNKNCELYFSNCGAWGKITEFSKGGTDETCIKVLSIDSLQVNDKITFIKADIEGGEIKMLEGANKTILRDKPRLAICIYHSNEDMLRIAEYIHDLVPEYRLYVRHHQYYPRIWETVLYATT